MRELAQAVLAEAQADAARTRDAAQRESARLLDDARTREAEALERAERLAVEASWGPSRCASVRPRTSSGCTGRRTSTTLPPEQRS